MGQVGWKHLYVYLEAEFLCICMYGGDCSIVFKTHVCLAWKTSVYMCVRVCVLERGLRALGTLQSWEYQCLLGGGCVFVSRIWRGF